MRSKTKIHDNKIINLIERLSHGWADIRMTNKICVSFSRQMEKVFMCNQRQTFVFRFRNYWKIRERCSRNENAILLAMLSSWQLHTFQENCGNRREYARNPRKERREYSIYPKIYAVLPISRLAEIRNWFVFPTWMQINFLFVHSFFPTFSCVRHDVSE